jgi:hypothetical protein
VSVSFNVEVGPLIAAVAISAAYLLYNSRDDPKAWRNHLPIALLVALAIDLAFTTAGDITEVDR